MKIYQKAEIFRRRTGNLDLIVNIYNDTQTTLLPVERPLIRSQLDRLYKALSLGGGGLEENGKGAKATAPGANSKSLNLEVKWY